MIKYLKKHKADTSNVTVITCKEIRQAGITIHRDRLV